MWSVMTLYAINLQYLDEKPVSLEHHMIKMKKSHRYYGQDVNSHYSCKAV